MRVKIEGIDGAKEYEAEAFSIGRDKLVVYNGKAEVHRIDGYKSIIIAIDNDSRCPDCNNTLVIQEGCERCINCGYSACKVA